MSKEKDTLLAKFKAWLDSEEPTDVKLEDKPKDIHLQIEVEDGDYKLEDGRTIVIAGDSVTIMDAPAPEDEPSEEDLAAKKLEEEEAEKTKLAAQTKEDVQLKAIEELKAQVQKLSEAKPLNNAPAKKAPKQFIEITANMTYLQRVEAGIANNTN